MAWRRPSFPGRRSRRRRATPPLHLPWSPRPRSVALRAASGLGSGGLETCPISRRDKSRGRFRLVATRWYEISLLTEAERKRFTAEAGLRGPPGGRDHGRAGVRRQWLGWRAGTRRRREGLTGRPGGPGSGGQGGARCAQGHRCGDRQGRRSGAAHRAASARWRSEGRAAPARRPRSSFGVKT